MADYISGTIGAEAGTVEAAVTRHGDDAVTIRTTCTMTQTQPDIESSWGPGAGNRRTAEADLVRALSTADDPAHKQASGC